ncbi:hypothetical protein pb186bvf_016209 [Paramecium bursaria]
MQLLKLLALSFVITIVLSQCTKCDGDHYCQNSVCTSCTSYRQKLIEQTPEWGQVVGSTYNVVAKSNKGDDQVIDKDKDTFLYPNETGLNETVYAGQAYQCVQYARQYWILEFGAAFESIDTANQIFGLKQAINYRNGGYLQMKSITNDNTDWPRVGDLLIWQKTYPNYLAGHVAVIVGTDYFSSSPKIYISEQNYDQYWDSNTYSRALKIQINNINGKLKVINQRSIENPEDIWKCRDYKGSETALILGWVRLIR